MIQLGIAQIAGNRIRPSMFGMNAAPGFVSLGGVGGTGIRLGETGQQVYARAKDAIARFDGLIARVQKVANQTAREELIKAYGLSDPENKDKALYMRNAVAGNVSQVESYTPYNYVIYETGKGPDVGRVTKLENFNHDLSRDVQYAEVTYGVLPDPVVIDRMVLVGGPSTLPGWVIPTVAVAVGVGVAAIFGWI